VEELVARLGKLEPNAQPRWGSLDGAGMVRHLIEVVRYTMGKGGTLPDQSTWFSRNILGPVFVNGWLRFPKNVKVPPAQGAPDLPSGPDDLETLHAVLEDYLARVQAGELRPKAHPLFGDIGVDGWAKLHVAHFEHHLRQFGL
jgi:hypothetical protein